MQRPQSDDDAWHASHRSDPLIREERRNRRSIRAPRRRDGSLRLGESPAPEPQAEACALLLASTEARCGLVTFEAAHRSVSSLDPTMVLFDSMVRILISPMFYTCIKFSPDRARVTVVTVRRDTRGSDAGHRFGRSEGRLGCHHVALLAQPDVDQDTETIDGTIKIAPATVHLDVCLANAPALADPRFTPPSEVIDESRRQLRLPTANRLIAEFDAPDQERLRQIARAQLVAKAPEDHACDDVGRILSAIENSPAAFIELLATGAAPEASVTPGRPLASFLHVRRVTLCMHRIAPFSPAPDNSSAGVHPDSQPWREG
jgi:hypothetical protein